MGSALIPLMDIDWLGVGGRSHPHIDANLSASAGLQSHIKQPGRSDKVRDLMPDDVIKLRIKWEQGNGGPCWLLPKLADCSFLLWSH